MPRNSSGTYTLPESAFVADTTILSAAMNSNLSDIATALTGSLAINGSATMSGPVKLDSGSSGAPSLTTGGDTQTGWYYSASGTWTYVTGGVDILSLSAVGGIITNLTVGNLTVTGSFSVAANRIVGEVVDFCGSSVPSLWLLAFGQAISRTTYAALFSAIGTTYGSGDGATTFNAPDYRGRIGVGKDNMGGSTAGRVTLAVSGITGTTLGATGGSQSVTIAITNLPSHSHTQQGTIETSSNTTSLNHTHNTPLNAANDVFNTDVTAATQFISTLVTNTDVTQGANSSLDHVHNVTLSGQTATTGSGTALGSMPPSIIVNKIIYVAV